MKTPEQFNALSTVAQRIECWKLARRIWGQYSAVWTTWNHGKTDYHCGHRSKFHTYMWYSPHESWFDMYFHMSTHAKVYQPSTRVERSTDDRLEDDKYEDAVEQHESTAEGSAADPDPEADPDRGGRGDGEAGGPRDG